MGVRTITSLMTVLALAAVNLPATAASLRSLVETEYAFAQAAEENGTRYAYLFYLAPDAIGFEPGPVLIYPRWKERLLTKGKLQWYPAYAEINRAGDLAYTVGPWTYTSPVTHELAYGDFVTIWRYSHEDSGDANWRVILQAGVTHGPPGKTAKALHPSDVSARALDQPAGSEPENRAATGACDDRYGAALMKHGEAAAFGKFAARNASLYVLGQQPAAGRKQALSLLAPFAEPSAQTRQLAGGGASPDLGYTYGVVQFSQAGAQYYLRIWRIHGATCRLVFELLRPKLS